MGDFAIFGGFLAGIGWCHALDSIRDDPKTAWCETHLSRSQEPEAPATGACWVYVDYKRGEFSCAVFPPSVLQTVLAIQTLREMWFGGDRGVF